MRKELSKATERLRAILAALGLCAMVCAISYELNQMGVLQGTELKFYDQLAKARRSFGTPAADAPIVIVSVSEEDIKKIGHYPITDEEMAVVLENITRAGAATIGVDIFRDLPVQSGRQRLDKIVGQNRNIVLVDLLDEPAAPNPTLPSLDPAQVGGADFPFDPDGIVRRGMLFMRGSDRVELSFALCLALNYLQRFGIVGESGGSADSYKLGKAIYAPISPELGGYHLPAEAAGGLQYLLQFDMVGQFHEISLGQVLSGNFDPKLMKDRIVLIGVTAKTINDLLNTPIQELDPGIHLHAYAIANLLAAAQVGVPPTHSWGVSGKTLWAVLWGLAGVILGILSRRTVWFIVAMTGAIITMCLVAFVFFRAGCWVPLAPSSINLLGTTVLTGSYWSSRFSRDRKVMANLFARYVSKPVFDAIWRQRDQIIQNGQLTGRRLFATVLFSDLKDSCGLAESMDPAALFELLNEYMAEMADCVIAHKGMLNRYIGDAVLAVFGAPLPSDTTAERAADAQNAIDCALAMRGRLIAFNKRKNLPAPLRMRIGIHSGEMIAGSVGSTQRADYTVIGSAVNITARLESYDKTEMSDDIAAGGCRILASGDTLDLATMKYLTRSLPGIRLAGISTPIVVEGLVDEIRKPSETHSIVTDQTIGGIS